MKKELLILSILLGVSTAFANEKGNGGIAHVCRDPKSNEIISIEMLDIRRGKKEMGLSYAPSSDNKAYLTRVYERLIGNLPVYQGVGEKLVGLLSGKIPSVKIDGGPLFWTDDGKPGEADPGCRFEQVGVFQNGILYMNQPLVDAMDKLNACAFYTHESIYALAKEKSGVTDSVESQKLNALLMADDSTPKRIADQSAKLFPRLPMPYGPSRWASRDVFWAPQMFLDERPVTLVFHFPAQSVFLGCSVRLAMERKDAKLGWLEMEEIPLMTFSKEWVTRSKKIDFTMQLPFLPSVMFKDHETAGLKLTSCLASVTVEAFQGGKRKGYWHQNGDGFDSMAFLFGDSSKSGF